MKHVNDYFKSARRQLRRLPRNARSNRWFVVVLGHVYVYSPRHARAFARRVGATSPNVSGREGIRLYVRPGLRLIRSDPIRPEVTGFLFPHLGRLGNAIRELVSAAAVADKYHVGHLVLQGFSLFSSEGDLANPGHTRTKRGLNLWVETNAPRSPKTPAPLALVRWSRRSLPLANSPHAWEEITSVLPSTLIVRTWGPQTLVIHLRGGDVFGGRNPRSYGQPPLAFYLWVLQRQEWSEVVIVHQDDSNPVLRPLLTAVAERGLEAQTFSGSLVEDLEVLLGAHTIVAGRGTFIPAIVGLSDTVRQVYYFENKFVLFPEKPSVTVTRVLDAQGDYRSQVLSDNWENSDAQRKLMVTYPTSYLDEA